MNKHFKDDYYAYDITGYDDNYREGLITWLWKWFIQFFKK